MLADSEFSGERRLPFYGRRFAATIPISSGTIGKERRIRKPRTDYLQALAYLFGRLNYERTSMPRMAGELRLARMLTFLRALGNPERAFSIVHVAGTKGKGSTASMIASALSGAHLKTGLFCSPHLHRVEERFQFDGQIASEDEFVDLVMRVQSVAEKLQESDKHLLARPFTFFEMTTAMGMLHFAQKKADVVVLEVGLGGRLDSTNAIRPKVSVITSISIDHTRQLGNTTAEIAYEKAGIIKRKGTVVSGTRDPDAKFTIEQVARKRKAKLYAIDQDFIASYEPPKPPLGHPSLGMVAVRTSHREWGSQRVPLPGAHQAVNAAVALATLDALAETDHRLGVDAAAVGRGWGALHVPARVEVVAKRPWVVIDGAHNVASAQALAATLTTHFPPSCRTLIFGTTRDKDLHGQLNALLPLFPRVIATRYVENPRAVPAADIASACESLGTHCSAITENPADALEVASRLSESDELICVTGSMFLAAEARALLLSLIPTQSTHAPATVSSP
jgi:dihydrofolate synthase/folylpolyglutamate synthase